MQTAEKGRAALKKGARMTRHKIELRELYIADYTVRKRDSGDLSEWFRGINSVVCPTSFKAKVDRNGSWENCVVSALVAYDNKDKLQVNLYFEDATLLSVCQLRTAYLPESYRRSLSKGRRAG